MPSELVVASKPWSISMGMPWVPSRFMLKPQANSPAVIFQNGAVRVASRNFRLWGSAAPRLAGLAAICSGVRSVCGGAWSRITNKAIGTTSTVNTAANPSKVVCHERSEEHTSELQSLMRISYAVFCLKKKKKKTIERIYQYRYIKETE